MIRDETVQPLVSSLDSNINLDDIQMEARSAITRKRRRLVAIVIGMFAAYVAHDFVQELVFSYGSFKFGWFMSLVEVTLISLTSFIQLRRSQRDASQSASVVPSLIEAKCAVALAVFITVTQGTGSAAIAYVSFPVKVVMKSAKLLPTMLIRRIFMGAKYNFAQVAAAIGTCASCAAFALVDINAASGSRPVSVIGIALLSIAVCADACTANTQEAIITRYGISTSRMVFHSNVIGAVMLLLTCGANGELFSASAAISEQPVIMVLLLVMGLCGCIGLPLYLLLVSEYSSAIAVASTTVRKAVTMALSIFLFGHAFTLYHVTALGMLGLSVTGYGRFVSAFFVIQSRFLIPHCSYVADKSSSKS